MALRYYLNEGLDMMFDHLKNGTRLPPTRVIRATPRGNVQYDKDNAKDRLPLPKMDPGNDAITFARRVLHISK